MCHMTVTITYWYFAGSRLSLQTAINPALGIDILTLINRDLIAGIDNLQIFHRDELPAKQWNLLFSRELKEFSNSIELNAGIVESSL